MERYKFMVEPDRIDWYKFKATVKQTLNRKQFELVCLLHAKYFNHRFYKPCTCNPKTIKLWIDQLDKLYEADRKN